MLINGDARRIPLADKSCQMCATSPPYWGLRDYGTATWEGGDAECEHKKANRAGVSSDVRNTLSGASDFHADTCPKCGARRIDAQLGLEASPEEYVANIVAVFREVWRVLRDDGVVWLNLGDSYAGSGKGGNPEGSQWAGFVGNKDRERSAMASPPTIPNGLKPKDLCMIPARVALALQADGWYLRSAPPWLKRNPMPESCTDRPTTAHETIFLLTKSKNYWYDGDAVRKPHARLWDATNAGSWAHTEKQPKGSKAGHHSGDYPLPDPAGRNRRTTDWWYESLDIAINETAAQLAHMKDVRDNGGMLCDEDGLPVGFMVNTHGYPGAHFATFPPKLVEPMILAGTSERGACPECGAGWVRVVEATGDYAKALQSAQYPSGGMEKGNFKGPEYARVSKQVTTTGWEPSCSCGHEDTVPCVILDPFCGSGTVAVVAKRLGRKSVCLDLSMEYLHMARERTGAKALAEWETGVQAEDVDLTGLPMFES